MGAYDRSSKWLIEHHGDALLRLAGVGEIRSWRALQPEVVQPAQLPDGLIEAWLEGSAEPRQFLIEIATYADQRVQEQILRGTLLSYVSRRLLPEALVVVLRPRGRVRVPGSARQASPHEWTELRLRWRVLNLWTVPGQQLLETGEAGLMPWVPLTRFEGEPGALLERCREVIERRAPAEERSTLLAVTQVLTRLRYNDAGLLKILGGRAAMIESPLIDELREEFGAEARAEAIVRLLARRFGPVPESLQGDIRAVRSDERLDDLLFAAAECPDLAGFEARLRS